MTLSVVHTHRMLPEFHLAFGVHLMSKMKRKLNTCIVVSSHLTLILSWWFNTHQANLLMLPFVALVNSL